VHDVEHTVVLDPIAANTNTFLLRRSGLFPVEMQERATRPCSATRLTKQSAQRDKCTAPRGSNFSRRCQSRRLRRIAETAEPSKGNWHRSDVGGMSGVRGKAGWA
jgi:hypothetical protein